MDSNNLKIDKKIILTPFANDKAIDVAKSFDIDIVLFPREGPSFKENLDSLTLSLIWEGCEGEYGKLLSKTLRLLKK